MPTTSTGTWSEPDPRSGVVTYTTHPSTEEATQPPEKPGYVITWSHRTDTEVVWYYAPAKDAT